MKVILLIIAFCFNSICIIGQPSIEWQVNLGGMFEDAAFSIRQTSDGGYIVGGYTFSNDGNVSGNHSSSSDFWIVKLTSMGILEWQKCLGGSDVERGYSIKQTSDEGYIVTGAASSNDGDITGNNFNSADFWVVKLDSLGILNWQMCFGSTGSDEAWEVQQTYDGGYVVAGHCGNNNGNVSGNHGSADYWVVKLDSVGNLAWQKCLGGFLDDISYSITQTVDSGFVVTGRVNSFDGDVTNHHGAQDNWVVKISNQGNLIWQKSLGGTSSDYGYSVRQTNDGGYIVVGNTNSNDGDVSGNNGSIDIWVVKLDSIGNLMWQKCLGGTNNEIGNSVQQTNDGGYIVFGHTNSNDGDVFGQHGLYDYWIAKLDGSGNLMWQKCLGGTNNEIGNSVQQTNDGGFILAGYSSSNDGDLTGNNGDFDYWVVKLSSVSGLNEYSELPKLKFYPNPVTDLITLDFSDIEQENITNFSIVNSQGKIKFISYEIDTKIIEISTKYFSPGLYSIVVLYKDKSRINQNFIVIKY